MNNISDTVERHYWKAVTFLVILILTGTGFWGLKRFAPTLFLGAPDLIAVPNGERPHRQTAPVEANPSPQPKPERGSTSHTGRRGDAAISMPALLNINTASAAELQTLPRIGEKMAQRIIAYRSEHGDFATVDAIQNVKGIGPKTLEKLRPFIAAE